MTANTPQLCSVASRKRARALLVCCVCVWPFIGGCSARKNTPNRWPSAGMLRPVMPATIAPHPRPLPEESVDPVPELRLEIPPPPPLLAARSTPSRPRVAPAPAADSGAAAKPEVPVIAPQLSAAESSAAQQQMTSSLAVAEKNLAYSQSKNLSATQTDLAAKVKEFVDDARAAARDGDWTRARSLATKAQVLSEELAGSL